MNKSITDILYANSDSKYRDFQSKLIPTVDVSCVIGVRTPILRKIARELKQESAKFLSDLPHKFFEENQLHAFVISEITDFNMAVSAVDNFLPFVDNWATCDQMSPKAFSKNAVDLLPYIKKWIGSKHTYTVRFGVLCLMRYFLDDNFNKKYVDMVVKIISDQYYINMMRAWYLATALAKQYDAVLPYLQKCEIDVWTHNRAIQKAIESYRVPDAHKVVLRALRRKS